MDSASTDPKGLIRESYRIDGITIGECRSIFLDWALSIPGAQDPAAIIPALLQQYGTEAPDHPMTQVLRQGLGDSSVPRRRGGWAARRRD